MKNLFLFLFAFMLLLSCSDSTPGVEDMVTLEWSDTSTMHFINEGVSGILYAVIQNKTPKELKILNIRVTDVTGDPNDFPYAENDPQIVLPGKRLIGKKTVFITATNADLVLPLTQTWTYEYEGKIYKISRTITRQELKEKNWGKDK